MAKTSELQMAINRLQAEINEREAALSHLRAVQATRPKRKAQKAGKASDVEKIA